MDKKQLDNLKTIKNKTMFNVNLEKELIKQNRVLLNTKELLLVQESDKLGELTENQTMKKVFGEYSAALMGKRIKEKSNDLSSSAAKFNHERVFHISQIKSLCVKYHLRFLPSVMFKGAIDPKLPLLLDQFQIANGIEFKEWKLSDRSWRMWSRENIFEKGNTFIAAPASSFELRERPKDPLFFYKINEEYFYLIHKWGNDLSLVRRIFRFFSGKFMTWLLLMIAPFLVVLKCSQHFQPDGKQPNGWEITLIITVVIAVVFTIFFAVEGEWAFIKANEWDSQFKD